MPFYVFCRLNSRTDLYNLHSKLTLTRPCFIAQYTLFLLGADPKAKPWLRKIIRRVIRRRRTWTWTHYHGRRRFKCSHRRRNWIVSTCCGYYSSTRRACCTHARSLRRRMNMVGYNCNRRRYLDPDIRG